MSTVKDTAKDARIIYQYDDDEPECFGEPAIIINNYRGNIGIEGPDGHVLINRSSVNELIRILKQFKANEPE